MLRSAVGKVCEIIVVPVENDRGAIEQLSQQLKDEIVNGPFMIDCAYSGVTEVNDAAEAVSHAMAAAQDPNRYMFIMFLPTSYNSSAESLLRHWEVSGRKIYGTFILVPNNSGSRWLEDTVLHSSKLGHFKIVNAQGLLKKPARCESVITHLAAS